MTLASFSAQPHPSMPPMTCGTTQLLAVATVSVKLTNHKKYFFTKIFNIIFIIT
jgi:hypothetical protein